MTGDLFLQGKTIYAGSVSTSPDSLVTKNYIETQDNLVRIYATT